MEGIETGAEQAKKVTGGKTKVGWIVIVSRNYGPEVGLKTAEFAKTFRNRIVRQLAYFIPNADPSTRHLARI